MKYVGTFETEGDKIKIMNVEMTDANVEEALISVAILMQETVSQCALAMHEKDKETDVSSIARKLYDDMIEKIGILKTIPIDNGTGRGQTDDI